MVDSRETCFQHPLLLYLIFFSKLQGPFAQMSNNLTRLITTLKEIELRNSFKYIGSLKCESFQGY